MGSGLPRCALRGLIPVGGDIGSTYRRHAFGLRVTRTAKITIILAAVVCWLVSDGGASSYAQEPLAAKLFWQHLSVEPGTIEVPATMQQPAGLSLSRGSGGWVGLMGATSSFARTARRMGNFSGATCTTEQDAMTLLWASRWQRRESSLWAPATRPHRSSAAFPSSVRTTAGLDVYSGSTRSQMCGEYSTAPLSMRKQSSQWVETLHG